MKNKYTYSFLFIILFAVSSCTTYQTADPDFNKLQSELAGSVLLDSLSNFKITPGIPYKIIGDIFRNFPSKNKKKQVSGIGSKQQLLETEGWGRVYSDPSKGIYMDSYDTKNGKINIWYKYPSFYNMDVSADDTLVVFYNNVKYYSLITNLFSFDMLQVSDELNDLPEKEDLYAEIRYSEHPYRKVSYWYSVQLLSDKKTFVIRNLQYEIYPVEALEINNEPTVSFKWR